MYVCIYIFYFFKKLCSNNPLSKHDFFKKNKTKLQDELLHLP